MGALCSVLRVVGLSIALTGATTLRCHAQSATSDFGHDMKLAAVGAAPGAAGPGTAGPGATGPGATGPGASGPGASGPGASGPGATGPGAAGPGPSGGGGGPAGGPPFAAPPYGRDPGPIKTITRTAESTISMCPQDNPICIADALEAYAEALRRLSPPLGPDVQRLPDIVLRAAHQIRTAKTRAQAVRAVKIAIAEVHKTIELIKADDPVVLRAETREGAFVAETLQVADSKLEKAVGL